jgi:hypothetical protein
LIGVNQSLLLGVILADGLPGGSTPTAPAAAADKVPADIAPTDARTQAAARKRRGDVSPARAELRNERVTRIGGVGKGRRSLAGTGVVVMRPS